LNSGKGVVDIAFYCYRCGQHIVIDAAGAEMQVECPKCQTKLVVPRIRPNVKPESVAPPPVVQVLTPNKTEESGSARNTLIKLMIGIVVSVGVVFCVIMVCRLCIHEIRRTEDPFTVGYNSGLEAVRVANRLRSWPFDDADLARMLAVKNGYTNDPSNRLFISGCREALDAVHKQSRKVWGGHVLQVVSNSRVLIQPDGEDEPILVNDYDGIDGDRVKGEFYYVGIYRYKTVTGAMKTVREYTAAPGTLLSR
jgi:DNA-directed RNA polymerase subunit RPC12/RpoP